ncbi:hypothetical protein [Nocardia sp. NPDC004750]
MASIENRCRAVLIGVRARMFAMLAPEVVNRELASDGRSGCASAMRHAVGKALAQGEFEA